MKIHTINILLILLLPVCAGAQQKVWVYVDSTYTRQQAMDSLREHGLTTLVHSKWLSAFTIIAESNQQQQLSLLPWVNAVSPCLSFETTAIHFSDKTRNPALRQIHAEAIMQAGLTGKGVKVGVVDAGFLMMNFNRKLKRLRKAGSIKSFRNYANNRSKPQQVGAMHGAKVVAYIGGSTRRYRFGLATGAEYYLAFTDENRRERRIEEDRWVAALEWLDSLGVRLVNTSLGYSIGFDNPAENHSPDSVDGHTSAITRAAEKAARRGMIIVVSAGNDGGNRFRVVSLPADAPSVIAVGATDSQYWKKQWYSSIGPTRIKQVKPEVSVFSQTGTSFSAPIITGLVACILERKPELTVFEVRDMLIHASHLSTTPNNYIGYGVPDARKVLALLEGKEVPQADSVIRTSAAFVELSCEVPTIAFHKHSPTLAHTQEILHPAQSRIRVERPRHTTHTTLAFKDRPVEIIWE